MTLSDHSKRGLSMGNKAVLIRSWDASADKNPRIPPVIEIGFDRSSPPSLMIRTDDGRQMLRVNRDGALVAVPQTWRGRLVMTLARVLRVCPAAPDWSPAASDGEERP